MASARCPRTKRAHALGVGQYLTSLFEAAFLECGYHLCSRGAFLHGFRLGIPAILDHRQVTTQFLEQIDELGDFLLGEERHLQTQVGMLLLQLGHAILRDQYDCRGHERDQRHDAIKQLKGRWIPASGSTKDRIGSHPDGNDRNQNHEIPGAPQKATHSFDTTLRVAECFPSSLLQSDHAFDVLIDML